MKSMRQNIPMTVLAACLLLVACNEDGIVGTGFRVNGSAQKGPFVVRSQVMLTELDAKGQASGSAHFDETKNDLGEFSVTMDGPGMVKITVTGNHYKEVTGVISASPLTLYNVVTVSRNDSDTAFVNVLTHVISGRVTSLVALGVDAQDALAQAHQEFLQVFSEVINAQSLPPFSKMSVYLTPGTDARGDAFLLAVSAAFSQYAANRARTNHSPEEGELQDILNRFLDDFADDGILNKTQFTLGLRAALRQLLPDRITENLKNRSIDVIGEALPVADINLFVDTDGDGIINSEDSDDDGDSLADEADPSPYISNSVQLQVSTNPSGPVNGTVTLSVQTDNVTEIAYLIDGVLIGTSSRPPYTLEWNPYFWSAAPQATLSLQYRDGLDVFLPVPQSMPLQIGAGAAAAITLSPADNTESSNRQLILEWDAGGEVEHARVQLWNETNQSQLLLDDTVPSTRAATPVLADGGYLWRVQATSIQGRTGDWSPASRFIVSQLAGQPPFIDLVATSVATTTGSYSVNEFARVQLVVSQLGTADMRTPFLTAVVLSKDEVYDGINIDTVIAYIRIDAIAAGQSAGSEVNAKITAEPGNYHLIAVTDFDNKVIEKDDPDNLHANNFVLGNRVTVLAPTAP